MARVRCTPSASTPVALAGLDAISRRVAPALQSASLRSYVLVVVVTAIALVATALAMAPDPSGAAALDADRVPRGVLAALIVAGRAVGRVRAVEHGRGLIAR